MNHIDQIKAYYGKNADWEAGEKGEKKSGPGVGKGEGSDVPDGEGNTAKRASEDVSGPFRTRVTHVVTAADLYVAVSGKKLLGATDGSHGSSKSGWKGVERVRKAPSYEILKVKNVPQNVAVNMVDWGSNNPKTSFWKDEETAYKAVERYLKKGEKVAAFTRTSRLHKRQEKVLEKWLASGGKGPLGRVTNFDELPTKVQNDLRRIKDGEMLWADVERWIEDNNNPHLRSMWAADKTAGNAGGLYGFPKALQNDCDVASRRVAKAAVRIAKAAYKKDARVAEFLSTHAKRGKSVPAKALVAAFAEMGPKIASTDAERLQELRDKQASTNKEAKLAYGLYGYYDKTSRLGLNACAELRHEAGVVASNLHRRRAAKHARISEYLSTHCKKARCAYSRLILDGYPEAEMRLASETPKTVDEWISWED